MNPVSKKKFSSEVWVIRINDTKHPQILKFLKVPSGVQMQMFRKKREGHD